MLVRLLLIKCLALKKAVTNVLDSIGHAIEDECQMRFYEEEAPALLTTLKNNYWHASKGTQQRLISIQTLMNKSDVRKWDSWSRSIRIKLGGWLLDCIMESSGWFYKQAFRVLRYQRGGNGQCRAF